MVIARNLLLAFLTISSIFSCMNKHQVQAPEQITVDSKLPIKLAIAPVSFQNSRIKLPVSEIRDVSPQLSDDAIMVIKSYLNRSGLIVETVTIDEDSLPPGYSIGDLCTAAEKLETDVVLFSNLELIGACHFGFKQYLSNQIKYEITLYEVSSNTRLWHGTANTNISRPETLSNKSEEEILNLFKTMTMEQAIPTALLNILPALHADMAGYKPPLIEKKEKTSIDYVVDVDRVPWVAMPKRKNDYALVVGIENYRDLPKAEYAVRDAKFVKAYLTRAMGFREENVLSLYDNRATKGDIEGYINTWLKTNIEKNSFVFIYYAGHGAPNPVTGESFIIPYDGNPAFPEASGIPIKKIFQIISEYNNKETLLVIDACFSGSGERSVIAGGSRPAFIKIDNPLLSSNKLICFTASSGTEISSSYPEKRHGLFTYFFLKGLQGEADINLDKSLTLKELYYYLTPQVKKTARQKNREQTPMILPNLDGLADRAELLLIKFD